LVALAAAIRGSSAQVKGRFRHVTCNLNSEKRIATLYFPAGVYTLNAVDKIGYYYRAPRNIVEQGSIRRDGAIFVSKRDPNKLREYIYRAGAITHVGNLSGVRHRLFDQDIPAEQF